jgi:hypothetical protein
LAEDLHPEEIKEQAQDDDNQQPEIINTYGNEADQ